MSSIVFTFTSIAIQYIIPSLTVACAYTKVYCVFQASTLKITQASTSPKIIRNAQRRRRTNILLILLSAVFFISWAPLNIFTILIKTANPFTVSYCSGYVFYFGPTGVRALSLGIAGRT